MGMDRPQDLAWMFIIFALIVITFGLGITSINDIHDAGEDETFFTKISDDSQGSDGVVGASTAQQAALGGEEESGSQTTQEGFILKSWQAMRDLGKTFGIMDQAINEAQQELDIPGYFWVLVSAGLLITFAVILYTWLRGS